MFADETGKKVRPALVLSSPQYQRARQEVIVAAVTSNIQRPLFGDHLVLDWRGAGLLFPSRVTGIIRTIKRAMISRTLGSLSRPDLEAVNRQIRRYLGV